MGLTGKRCPSFSLTNVPHFKPSTVSGVKRGMCGVNPPPSWSPRSALLEGRGIKQLFLQQMWPCCLASTQPGNCVVCSHLVSALEEAKGKVLTATVNWLALPCHLSDTADAGNVKE